MNGITPVLYRYFWSKMDDGKCWCASKNWATLRRKPQVLKSIIFLPILRVSRELYNLRYKFNITYIFSTLYSIQGCGPCGLHRHVKNSPVLLYSHAESWVRLLLGSEVFCFSGLLKYLCHSELADFCWVISQFSRTRGYCWTWRTF